MAASRKAQDPSGGSAQRTPAFFSQLKYERDLKHLEQKAIYMQSRVSY